MNAEKIIKKIKKIAGVEEKRSYEMTELEAIYEYAKDYEVYFDVDFNDEMSIQMILIGQYGMHIFINLQKKSNFDEIRALISEMVYKYHLDPKTRFWGKIEGLFGGYIMSADGEIVKSNDFITDFENYDRNIRMPEVELNRLNIKSLNDYLMSRDDIKIARSEYEEESINLENEGFVREILSDEMIEYYKSKFTEEEKIIRKDEEGNEYKKHETRMKILGLSIGEAYYRVSDEDSERTFYITLFGGLFGLHHLLRGDFLRAILYMLTGGGFAVLYIADVISVCTGAYYYDEVRYGIDENGRQTRKKERVYLREIEDKKKRILGIIAATLIGFIFTLCVIKPGYTKINDGFSDATKAVTDEYIENKYDEIMELYKSN